MEIPVQSTDWLYQPDSGAGYQLADESEDSFNRNYGYDDMERFRICGRHVYGGTLFSPQRCHGGGKGGWCVLLADF